MSMVRHNKVDARMIEYEEISHGFLNFYTLRGMKEVDMCVKDSLAWMEELFYEKQK